MEWMKIFQEPWLIPLTLSLIIVIFIVLMIVAYYRGEGKGLAKYSPVAEIMTALILFLTLLSVYNQIGHLRTQNDQFRIQNELQRNVASKSAIQALNEVILSKDGKEDFLPFLFPDLYNKESKPTADVEAQEIMMAFSLMNSLEMLYLTQDEAQRKEKASRDKFKCLIKGFTGKVREIWEETPNFTTVYHPSFQEIVNEVFDKPLTCPKPN